MAFPNERYVKLKSSVPGGTRPFYTVYLPASGIPTVSTHGILAQINTTDPARARMLEQRLGELVRRNEQFFQWLEASAANATLFTYDPLAAVKAALPDLPADFFEGWNG